VNLGQATVFESNAVRGYVLDVGRLPKSIAFNLFLDKGPGLNGEDWIQASDTIEFFYELRPR
jgi:hypothetical protein